MSEKKLVIIDCDTGVDDAQAIMLALSHPNWELCAITCVQGNISLDSVLRNTLKVLDVWENPTVPVFRGSATPLVRSDQRLDLHHGHDGLGDAYDLPVLDDARIPSEPAASALARLSRQHQGNITLVAIGPLTNLALAHRLDCDFSRNLDRLVIMGGNMEGQGNMPGNTEFNFYQDPEAAFIVLNEFICPKSVVTWEACLKNQIPWDFHTGWSQVATNKGRFNGDIMRNQCKRKRKNYPGFHSCDGFAMVVALEPESAVEKKKVYATVELNGQFTRAQLVIDWRAFFGKEPNIDLIVKIDPTRIMELFMNCVQ